MKYFIVFIQFFWFNKCYYYDFCGYVVIFCAYAKAGFKFNLYWQHLNEIVKKQIFLFGCTLCSYSSCFSSKAKRLYCHLKLVCVFIRHSLCKFRVLCLPKLLWRKPHLLLFPSMQWLMALQQQSKIPAAAEKCNLYLPRNADE